MRRGAESLREQNVLVFDGLIKIALSETEARAGDLERAIATLDEALATVERTGCRAFEAELRRARGEMLLRRDPANFAGAEQAFQTAVAVARQQGTRCFELRAALSLAKLCKSTGRPAEAHAILASVLEGFSPTPEMPEIAEAQALLAPLAESEEVKAAEAQRQRRLHLQTAYGQALMWGKGLAAEETEDAFARVGDFAGPVEKTPARFVSYHAQVLRHFTRGESLKARETAESFLREAEAEERAAEAGAARSQLGLILLHTGDLRAARSTLERVLADYDPVRDRGAQLQFGPDTDVRAAGNLALAEWHLGEAERARQTSDRAIRRAHESGRAATLAVALLHKCILEIRRNDAPAAQSAADAFVGVMEDQGVKAYGDLGQAFALWARGRLVDPEAGAGGLRRALAADAAQGNKRSAAMLHGLLAELEAVTRGPDSALALVDEGLAIAADTGDRFTDPYLHRLRGDILLKRDSANPVPAEEAFQTAIAIAKQQGARSYELLASLSLAKLYQSTARQDEAYAVLAPAIEGFTPTLEMPEIAEAQALLERLAHGGDGAIPAKDPVTED
jgi:predicted ATPase